MATRIRASDRERVITLLQGRTQKEVASLLGVSERSIRRWKNENVSPSHSHHSALVDSYIKERRTVARDLKRQGIKPIDVPVSPRGNRRVLRDAITGRRYESQWVSYDIRNMPRDQIARLLATMQKRRDFYSLQFIYKTRPESKRATKKSQWATQMFALDYTSADTLMREYDSLRQNQPGVLYISVLERAGHERELAQRERKRRIEAAKKI